MIILEGADLVGKTTLANELSEMLPLHVIKHFGVLPENWHGYWSYVPFMRYNYILDRFYLSELIYSQILGRTCKISARQQRLIEAHLCLVPAYTCILVESEYKLRHRADEGHPLDKVLEANGRFNLIENSYHTRTYIGAKIRAHLIYKDYIDFLRTHVIETSIHYEWTLPEWSGPILG